MESQILDAALSQGIWAVLFVALLFYILRSQEKRDEKQEEREAELPGTADRSQSYIQTSWNRFRMISIR